MVSVYLSKRDREEFFVLAGQSEKKSWVYCDESQLNETVKNSILGIFRVARRERGFCLARSFQAHMCLKAGGASPARVPRMFQGTCLSNG